MTKEQLEQAIHQLMVEYQKNPGQDYLVEYEVNSNWEDKQSLYKKVSYTISIVELRNGGMWCNE